MDASIIIPAYNSEKTLKECLEALAQQNFQGKFEVIVVDDGSTDGSATIAKEFAKKDRKFRVVRQKNSGPAAARNNGARNAKNEIVVFIDSDCIAEKNWLEEMLAPFRNKNVAGVQGAYKTSQKELIAKFDQTEIEYRYERLKARESIDHIGSYSAAYKKSVFLENSGFDEKFRMASGEDPELAYRLEEKGHKLVFNPKAVVWHFHPDSLAKYLKTKFFRAFWRVRMYKKHSKKMVSDSYTPQELKLQIAFFYLGTILLFFNPVLALASSAMIVALSLPFFVFALKKDFAVALFGIAVIFLRTVVFGVGLIAGMLNGVFK